MVKIEIISKAISNAGNWIGYGTKETAASLANELPKSIERSIERLSRTIEDME